MWLCGMIFVLVTPEINYSLDKVAVFILAKSALAKVIGREWSRACMQLVEGRFLLRIIQERGYKNTFTNHLKASTALVCNVFTRHALSASESKVVDTIP